MRKYTSEYSNVLPVYVSFHIHQYTYFSVLLVHQTETNKGKYLNHTCTVIHYFFNVCSFSFTNRAIPWTEWTKGSQTKKSNTTTCQKNQTKALSSMNLMKKPGNDYVNVNFLNMLNNRVWDYNQWFCVKLILKIEKQHAYYCLDYG